MPLNDTEYFSDILRELGFVRADEAGLSHTESQHESDRGTFLAAHVLWVGRTFAIDQTGRAWVAYDLIDLTPYGFRDSTRGPYEIDSPYKLS